MSMAIPARADTTPIESGVEDVRERIAALVARRQQLRALGAGRALLEQNRLDLARSHRDLGYALIERHLLPPVSP
jgi:hypothetical protein